MKKSLRKKSFEKLLHAIDFSHLFIKPRSDSNSRRLYMFLSTAVHVIITF